MPRIISFIIQKGGCGKTTTTVNTAGYLARMGIKTLVVDMDPQGNLTQHLGYNTDEVEKTVLHLLKGEEKIDEVILKRSEFLHVLPNNIESASAEVFLYNAYTREYLLRDALYPVLTEYDFILIDCPPNLGLYSINALATSTEFIMVAAPEFFPMKAIKPLVETYNMVRTKLNHSLRMGGVLVGMADLRTRHAQQVMNIIRKNFGKQLFQNYIRNNVDLKEAAANGQTIFEYAPDSIGARDFQNFVEEFLKDHHKIREKWEYYEEKFNELPVEQRAELIGFAEQNLRSSIRERLKKGEASEVLDRTLMIARNSLLEKMYPYRYEINDTVQT